MQICYIKDMNLLLDSTKDFFGHNQISALITGMLIYKVVFDSNQTLLIC